MSPSRPSTPTRTPASSTLVNGTHSIPHTPKTPVNHNFFLTEYAANATPPERAAQLQYTLPADFLLSNGTPDVSIAVSDTFIF
jgi:hypothetical protein